MAFTAVYVAESNTMEFFFDSIPTVLSVDEVELTRSDAASQHRLLFGEVAWVKGLFCGKDVFTFGSPLEVPACQPAGLAATSQRLWCRLTARCVDTDALQKCLTRGPALLPTTTTELPSRSIRWICELAISAVVASGAIVFTGGFPEGDGISLSPLSSSFPAVSPVHTASRTQS